MFVQTRFALAMGLWCVNQKTIRRKQHRKMSFGSKETTCSQHPTKYFQSFRERKEGTNEGLREGGMERRREMREAGMTTRYLISI